jgi:hypothetical protein
MPALSKKYHLRTGVALAAALWLGTGVAQAQKIRFIDIDPQQVGTAQPAELGLADALWVGSTRAGLAEAIDSIQGASPQLAAHRALAAMLGASAALPHAAAPGETLSPPLISRRVAALARLAANDEAIALARRAPQDFRDTNMLAAETDVRLLRFDLSGACNLMQANAAASATESLQPLRAFCLQVDARASEAIVSAMLGNLPGAAADDTFAALFLAMKYPNRGKPAGIVPATALHAAMYRYMRLRPAAGDKLPAAPASVMASLGKNPNLPFEMRTQAMERAVAFNAGDVETLAQLYLEGGGTTGVGPAYRKAAFAQNTPARLEALQALWTVAQQQGLIAQLAPFTLGTIAGLDLAAVQPNFIRDALRAALLAQDRSAIATWRDAQSAAALLPAGAASRDASYGLLALAGESVPPVEQWWNTWKKAAKLTDGQQQLVGGALGALGTGFALLPSPKIKRKSVSYSIQKLAKTAPGEAALRALAALASQSSADVALQVTAVRTLARVHPGHARALALELAVASGL